MIKDIIKGLIPMRAISLLRCMKAHRSEGKAAMVMRGIKDFHFQQWVYPHSKEDEEAYLEQLDEICRKIEIDDKRYFFYPFSEKLHRYFPTHCMPILSITPAYEEVLKTDFTVYNDNAVVKSLYKLIDRVKQTKVTNSRFEEIKQLCLDVLKPAESFEGAIQKILFFHALLWQMGHGHNGLGRLDMALFPFYKKDLEMNRISRKDAEHILREMIAIAGSQIHQKSATLYGDTGQYILLGGIDKENNNVQNELTLLFLNIFSDLSIPDPKLILRVNANTSTEIYDAAARCLLKGNGSPLLMNEDKIIPLMEKFGYDVEDCYNVGTSACWEPLVLGKSFDQNNNLTSISPLRALNKTILTSDTEHETFEDFLEVYEKDLERNIQDCAHDLVMDCSPLFSLLFSDVRHSGKDISKGGAKYAYNGMLVTGLPNAVNALLNIKHLVFEQHLLSLSECKVAMADNFEHMKDLRALLQNQPQKFGKCSDEVIALTNRISDKIENVVADIKINGKKAKVGFSSPNYIAQAHDIGASLDGRVYGAPMSTHISPVGKDVDITEVINFAAQMNFDGCRINGNVVDFIIPSAFKAHPEKLSALLKDCTNKGIYELQLNVLDKETLIDAKLHLEKYPNLVVRVWGFSAYFNELPEEYKDNLIRRAEEYAHAT